jgi:uncharacterized membrane protein YfcA
LLGINVQSAVIIALAAVAINSISTTKTKRIHYRSEYGRYKGDAKFNTLKRKAGVFRWGIAFASLVTGFVFGFHKDAVSVHLIDALFAGLLLVMVFSDQIRQVLTRYLSEAHLSRPSKIQDFIAGTVVGALSSAIGVGGATYTMNYFAIRHNIELKDSTTVSNYTGLAVGAAGVLGFLLPSLMHHKTIDLGMPLVYVGLILLTGWFGAQWGVVLQKYANVSSIKRLIYAMLIGTILKNELPLEEVTHMQPQTLSLIIAVCSMLIALHMVRKERKSKDAFDAEE